MSSLEGFFLNFSTISLIVLAWLSAYFIITIWIFFYKNYLLKGYISKEKKSLNSILNGDNLSPSDKFFRNGIGIPSKELLLMWRLQYQKKVTDGLVFLSVISSTAPFIGLFGTVVEILEAFGRLGGGQISFDIIAPIISKALIATAAGILTAIPAYSFYLILKRRAYDVSVLIQMQVDTLLSRIGD